MLRVDQLPPLRHAAGCCAAAAVPQTAATLSRATGIRRAREVLPRLPALAPLQRLPDDLWRQQLLPRLSDVELQQLAQACRLWRAPSHAALLERLAQAWQQLHAGLATYATAPPHVWNELRVLQALQRAAIVLPRLLRNAQPTAPYTAVVTAGARRLSRCLCAWLQQAMSSKIPLPGLWLETLLQQLTCLQPYVEEPAEVATYARLRQYCQPQPLAAVALQAAEQQAGAARQQLLRNVASGRFEKRFVAALTAYRQRVYGNQEAQMAWVEEQCHRLSQQLRRLEDACRTAPQAVCGAGDALRAALNQLAAFLLADLQHNSGEEVPLQLSFWRLLSCLQEQRVLQAPQQQAVAACWQHAAELRPLQQRYAMALCIVQQAALLQQPALQAVAVASLRDLLLRTPSLLVGMHDLDCRIEALGGLERALALPAAHQIQIFRLLYDYCQTEQSCWAYAAGILVQQVGCLALPEQRALLQLLRSLNVRTGMVRAGWLLRCAGVMPSAEVFDIVQDAVSLLHDSPDGMAMLRVFVQQAKPALLQRCVWQANLPAALRVSQQLAAVLRRACDTSHRLDALALLHRWLAHVRPAALLQPLAALLQVLWQHDALCSDAASAAPLQAAGRAYVETLSLAACQALLPAAVQLD